MRHARLAMRAGVMFLIVAFLCVLAPAAMRAQSPQPYAFHSREEMNDLVAPVALYPDPLLYQVISAASFPDQISGAADWADRHSSLYGAGLVHAMLEDHLSWDPAVQALLPFPEVLQMLAHDINWTTDLGDALLDQRADMMDALQAMRHRAQDDGALRSNSQVTVYGKQYIQITAVTQGFVVVPVYRPAIVYAPPQAGSDPLREIGVECSVKMGPEYDPWGWRASRFLWSQHEMTTHRSAPRYEPAENRIEKPALQPR
jgi:hypothetical protein